MPAAHSFHFLPAKWVFILFILTVTITSVSVYISGIHLHRSLFQNGIISLSIISASFFLFITTSLFFGFRLKENLGDLTKRIKWQEPGEGPSFVPDVDADIFGPAAEEGIGGLIMAIAGWIFFSLLLVLLMFFFETIVWAMLMVFLGMLYWVFYRALKMIFRNSGRCKGKFLKSAAFSALYTIAYSSRIYALLYIFNVFSK